MKKIILSLSLLMTAGLSTIYANDDPTPDKEVLNLFKKEFSSAESVSWSRQGDYDKATFVLAGRRAIAYFNANGELEGSVRDIFFDQLPLTVMTAVDKRFADAEIIDVREINNAEGTHYRIRLTAKSKKYSVKVDPSGSIGDIEKLVK
ncbi:MAG TPA: hypothetical protein VGO58_05905 [Chitinophagaceae bacterium]|jgi:hypothetical protein|nr:hypothetical protein [Chitinophagaceae bacterium]